MKEEAGERKFGPEMRLKSQIINRVSLASPRSILEHTVSSLFRLTRGSYAQRVHEAKKEEISREFDQKRRKKREEKKTLLHFNADQNTQKVFLFVGVAQ